MAEVSVRYVNCSGPCTVTWSQGSTVLNPGDTFAADHPLVRERPDLFSGGPPATRVAGGIETGERRPGQAKGRIR